MTDSWKVHADGQMGNLEISEDAISLTLGNTLLEIPVEDWTSIAFPNAYCSALPRQAEEPLQIGFSNRQSQSAFAQALAERLSARGLALPDSGRVPTRPAVLLLTTAQFPGRQVQEVLGLITAHSVMSRGAFSDAGSDLKSLVGGSLGGMERAVGSAIEKARARLQEEARLLGGDSVVGVSVSIAGVGDKAEAIVMAGTAVRTVLDKTYGVPLDEQ